MLDFAMPFLIQTLREYTSRIDALDKKTQKKEEAEQKEKSASNDLAPDYMVPAMMGGAAAGFGQLSITGGPAMQQPMQQQAFPQAGMQPTMMMQPGMMQPGMMQPGMM